MTRIRLEISKQQALALEDLLAYCKPMDEFNKHLRYMLFKVTHSSDNKRTLVCDKTGIKVKGVDV
jgi:hypothetical protein